MCVVAVLFVGVFVVCLSFLHSLLLSSLELFWQLLSLVPSWGPSVFFSVVVLITTHVLLFLCFFLGFLFLLPLCFLLLLLDSWIFGLLEVWILGFLACACLGKDVSKRAECLALARSAKAKHEVSDPLGF